MTVLPQPAKNKAQKRTQPFHQVHQKQGDANDAAGGLFQAHGNMAQTVSSLAGSEDAFHLVAVATVLIFLLFGLTRQFPILGRLA